MLLSAYEGAVRIPDGPYINHHGDSKLSNLKTTHESSLVTAHEISNTGTDAQFLRNMQVPLHLRNASSELMQNLNYGKNYQYAHDYEGYITNMKCLPENLEDKKYYIPKQSGGEKVVAERLARIEKLREYIEKSN